MAGYKTYLSAIILVVVSVLYWAGVITKAQYDVLFGIFGAAGLAALRAGISKLEQ